MADRAPLYSGWLSGGIVLVAAAVAMAVAGPALIEWWRDLYTGVLSDTAHDGASLDRLVPLARDLLWALGAFLVATVLAFVGLARLQRGSGAMWSARRPRRALNSTSSGGWPPATPIAVIALVVATVALCAMRLPQLMLSAGSGYTAEAVWRQCFRLVLEATVWYAGLCILVGLVDLAWQRAARAQMTIRQRRARPGGGG